MRHSFFLLSLFTAALPGFAAAPADAETGAKPAARLLEITYSFALPEPEPGAESVEVWAPLISAADGQRVELRTVNAPFATETAWDADFGNSLLHAKLPAAEAHGTVTIITRLARSEIAARPAVLTARERALYLRAEKLVTLSPRVRKLAADIVRGRNSTMTKARALYDYTVSVMRYDKTLPGWGNGDTERACDLFAGNCTDFHSLFISLARSAGIPARFVMGYALPAAGGTGEISGYHCWAEFFDARAGWVPVDASEASKHPEKRNYFFGRLDRDRVALSLGRDLRLTPSQAGGPVNYLLKPVLEADGKPQPAPLVTVRYRDLDAAAAPAPTAAAVAPTPPSPAAAGGTPAAGGR